MSVTKAQLVGGVGISTAENLVVSGVTTSTSVVVGSATTFTEDLVVQGDARVTGILTVGTSSITLDGTNNQINVGTGLTLSSDGITAGVITATSFSGDGSGLTGVGIGSDGSVNTTGIITATSFSGDGSGLSGVGIGTTANLQANSLVVGIVTAQGFFTVLGAATPLGAEVEGGYLICKASSVGWIVAPNISEVSRDWYCRDDATTTAQLASGCTGWFVPTCGQLRNPGYTCRTYWDSYSADRYWSSTENCSDDARTVNFNNGANSTPFKTNTCCVRAFRCVSY